MFGRVRRARMIYRGLTCKLPLPRYPESRLSAARRAWRMARY